MLSEIRDAKIDTCGKLTIKVRKNDLILWTSKLFFCWQIIFIQMRSNLSWTDQTCSGLIKFVPVRSNLFQLERNCPIDSKLLQLDNAYSIPFLSGNPGEIYISDWIKYVQNEWNLLTLFKFPQSIILKLRTRSCFDLFSVKKLIWIEITTNSWTMQYNNFLILAILWGMQS